VGVSVNHSGMSEDAPHRLTIDTKGDNLEVRSHRIPIVGLMGVLRTLHSAGLALTQSLPTPADPLRSIRTVNKPHAP
jgi:hypothetical protein